MNDEATTQNAEPQTLADELTPTARARSAKPSGPALKVGDNEWRLRPSGLATILTEVRDRLYDESILRRKVRVEDCRLVAYYALHANYRLSDAEVARLIYSVEPQALVDATMESLYQWLKRPTLLEFAGPLMISSPFVSNVQYRLSEFGGATLIVFRHTAFGYVPAEHKAGMEKGWTLMHEATRKRAEAGLALK